MKKKRGFIQKFNFLRKRKDFFPNLLNFQRFFRQIRFNPAYLTIPISLGLLAAFFEGVSLGLLLPVSKGVVNMDFGFVEKIPVFKQISYIWPGLFKGSKWNVFFLLIAVIFIATIIKNILRYFSSVGIKSQIRQISHRIRAAVMNRFLSFGMLFFDRVNKGELNYILMDCRGALISRIMKLHDIFTKLFMLSVYLVIMVFISWKLTVLIIFLFPVLNYALKLIILKIKETAEVRTDVNISLNRKLFNIFSCIPLIKSYCNEFYEEDEFSDLSSKLRDSEFGIDKKRSLIEPLQEIILLGACIFIIIVIAVIVSRQGTAKVSGFLVYFLVVRRASESFKTVNEFKAVIADIRSPLAKLLSVFDDKDKYFIHSGKKEFSGLKEKIEFKSLRFSYNSETPVLKDIDFAVQAGKSVAVVGPTGAGKTTIIDLLMRFYEVPDASVFVDGSDIKDFTVCSLRKHIALVSQDILLFNDTIKNNIAYGLGDESLNSDMILKVVKKARLEQVIDKLPQGLDTYIGDRGIKLSGGEKQRVAIARALMKNSEILILDEATSSLDTHTERLIQEAVEEAMVGRTAMIIAHRLSTVKNVDTIIVVEDGRVCEKGRFDDLLAAKGKFYKYWQEQQFF